MLVTVPRAGCNLGSHRAIHTSSFRGALAQLEKSHNPEHYAKMNYRSDFTPHSYSGELQTREETVKEQRPKRNEAGVQLLSKSLHSQIFKKPEFPPPDPRSIVLAREHLEAHNLDPYQGSVLPETEFVLPLLQGENIDEHFHCIGIDAAEPYLSVAKKFAGARLPLKPSTWNLQSGWTKYEDGRPVKVDAPDDEDMLVFDVETLPNYHPYAVMACAASDKYWYSWISPWLLGETDGDQQLIPLGNRVNKKKLIVGHNVSYDRARVLEEYNVEDSSIRYLDTMSLHVAVKGISSHQRPAWLKYRKNKEAKMKEAIAEAEEQRQTEWDMSKRNEWNTADKQMSESLMQLSSDETTDAEASSKRWEDVTSANSLADVAKLYCNIRIEKATRNDFMTLSREEILGNIQKYLNYCSSDVEATHAVFTKVFPDFLLTCPSPVSFAGVLRMGSSFLTVDENWEEYLKSAEGIYLGLKEKIKKRLEAVADEARRKMENGLWKDDMWLSQLDWTPKTPRKPRGVESTGKSIPRNKKKAIPVGEPAWYKTFVEKGPFNTTAVKNQIIPLLLRFSYEGKPLRFSNDDGWTYTDKEGENRRPLGRKLPVRTIMGKAVGLKGLEEGLFTCDNKSLAASICSGEEDEKVSSEIKELALKIIKDESQLQDDPWMSQLDWTRSETSVGESGAAPEQIVWPKWYWDLTKPKKGVPSGTLDVTIRSRVAPLLLQLSWKGWPLFHSREHGWTFRVDPDVEFETRQNKLEFHDAADATLLELTIKDGYSFYKLPHKDGDKANVGNPFGKTFIKYAQDGTLTSPGEDTKAALEMNAQCSYWISSRDRILNQMVVWKNDRVKLGAEPTSKKPGAKVGMIIPQVITMGAVTRRAIERTWLTASNAKKDRVGSELKAMVRAPSGYKIVGADVDSEELWIASIMGDAQFGLHGATALGWMTLEGTKSAGTDLHSKTASILGINRDQAKVFNYSRIYGAGMKHAILLLLQSNPSMPQETAQGQAEKLYHSTKGQKIHEDDHFKRNFWYGGTESYVFNKLEEIAMSDKPLTPALGCGVTYALSKEYLQTGFGNDYMTSRINWVVQSSGVDYLHLLIVSMEYLCKKYEIQARYLISVHDELRYLVKDEDRFRAALALQIANLWTRCLFAYKLGMEDLPQGVAFFSAVDIDHVLRKEVDLPCVTPSQPSEIPPGESLNIQQVLEKTDGGSSLLKSMSKTYQCVGSLEGYTKPDCLKHRTSSAYFLKAQAASSRRDVKGIASMEKEEQRKSNVPKRRRDEDRLPSSPLPNDAEIEHCLSSNRRLKM